MTDEDLWRSCTHNYFCARAYLQSMDSEEERHEWRYTFEPWECLNCSKCELHEKSKKVFDIEGESPATFSTLGRGAA